MDKLKFYALAAISAIAAILGVYGYARKSGELAEQKKQQSKINQSIKEARNVENQINAAGISDIRERMRNHWTRS